MVAGLVVIGWRIVRGVRRREAKPNDLDVMAHRDGPT
jgi:hypothetical protein